MAALHLHLCKQRRFFEVNGQFYSLVNCIHLKTAKYVQTLSATAHTAVRIGSQNYVRWQCCASVYINKGGFSTKYQHLTSYSY